MNVLGILVCEVLELEFAHLLAQDREIARVTVVDDPRSARLQAGLRREGCTNFAALPHLEDFLRAPGKGLEVLVLVLELGLHARKKQLQRGLTEAARRLGPLVDTLFLGYGLCGNALEEPQELLADAGVPVILPMDDGHPVDDCVGMVIGGRRAYYAEQCKKAGTFFMTPGWTFHWERIFDKEFGNISLDLAKSLFANYERSLLLTTPLMSEEEMKRNAQEFNRLFDCSSEVRAGTLDILREGWTAAKQRATIEGSGNPSNEEGRGPSTAPGIP